ncbi:MAG: hypothetical protein JW384_01680 [Nitrosomonadaceae bacterium]|nr:hypothetical protein [Nitrosomonadaceae bacterium]
MSGAGFENCFLGYREALTENCVGGNIMLLNSALEVAEIEALIATVRASWSNTSFTVLVDPRDPEWRERLGQLREVGVSGIKFHCYIQQLSEVDFASCVALSILAQSLGLVVMIDTSYGSLDMYRFDNLRLAAAIATQVRHVPVVLLHSGGARCIEALLLADAADNVYLETSFSLPYYLGSSIERDLAFAYRKLGDERVLYGSDFPYVGLEESKDKFLGFLEHWRFSTQAVERMLRWNGMAVLRVDG